MPQILRLTQASIQESSFDANRDTVVIVHGHRESAFTSLNPSVKDGKKILKFLIVAVRTKFKVVTSLAHANI